MAVTASTQQLAVANLYIALFNRAPDAAGLAFWVQALGNGASLATITQSLLTTAEAKAIYPAAQTAEQFVTGFYQSVLGRTPDAAGLAFWTAALNADGGAGSEAAKALLVSQIVGVANTPLGTKPADLTEAQYAQAVADRAVFANKVTVGVYYAVELGGTNVDVAKQALAGVGSTAASVDAAKLVAGGTSSSAPVVVAPVASLLATAATDTLSGTAGNDTFTASNLTLSALDSIDGGAGIDTLNYMDASTTNAAFPAAAVRNVEIINVRNVNTAGWGAEVFSADMGSDNGLSPGQTLTIAGLTVTGTGYASDNDIAVAFRTGVTVGNAAVSGTLNPGYTVGGSNNTVLFTSRVPGNVPDLVISGSNANDPNANIIQGTNGSPDTVVAANFIGATNFNSDRSQANVVFTGLIAGQAVGVVGNNSVVSGQLTGTYAAGVTAATLNLSGGTKGGAVKIDSVSGSALATVTITSTGALANIVGALAFSPSVTALAIDASTNLQMSGITTTGLQTLTVSGTATKVSLDRLGTGLASIDASGLTAGSVSVLLGSSPAVTFKGSAGNDTVAVDGSVVMTGLIDAGAGTGDILFLNTGSSLNAVIAPRFTNFEILRVVSDFGTQGFDASLIVGITSYLIAGSSGQLILNNLANNAAITVLGSSGNVFLNLLDTSGAADSLNLTMGNAVSGAEAITSGISLTLRAPGVETIYLHSTGGASGAGTNVYTNNGVVNTSLSKIVIDGSQSISLRSLTSAVALTVDAASLTGILDVRGSGSTQVLNVTGGSASDSIAGGGAGGLIIGSAGGDSIALVVGNGVDTVGFLTASDSTQNFVNAAGTAEATQDAISGFATGTDKIDLKAFGLDVAIRSFVAKTFATTALLVVGEAATDFYLDGGTNRGAVAARIGSDTYLVVDANGDHLFSAATDLVVKLTGVTALAQGDVVYA